MIKLTTLQKQTIWNQYSALFDAKQQDQQYWSLRHCTRVLTALMACRDFSWRVVGITEKALIQYSNQNFRRLEKDGITRGHITPRLQTAEKVLSGKEPLSLDDFFEQWLRSDETVLCARGENRRELPTFIPFSNKENLFNCQDMTVGFRHGEKEIEFLENLYQGHLPLQTFR